MYYILNIKFPDNFRLIFQECFLKVATIEKENLLSMVFCALLMSAIDKQIHKDEWAVIQGFIKQHWQKEYGDFSKHKQQMTEELKEVVSSYNLIKVKLEKILADLNPRLRQQQKNLLLQLVGDVMAADNVMALEESDLFAVFLKNLGIQNQP